MFRSIIRVLLGFVLACFAAGAVKVLFALTPGEVFGGDSDALGNAVYLAIQTATQSGVFAAPFALIAAAIGEWNGLRRWPFYVLAGIAIALAGFVAQYQSEELTQPTIVNNYALTAFLTAGFIGGLVYWVVAGREAAEVHQPETAVGRPGSMVSAGNRKP